MTAENIATSRRSSRGLAMMMSLGLALAVSPLFAQLSATYEVGDLDALQEAFEKIAEEVRPSVVAIHTETVNDSRHPWEKGFGHGSGFVLTADGYILTNEHVVDGSSRLTVVLFNGAEYEAKVIGTDPRRDLAVVKIDHQHLRPVTFGKHEDLRPGHWALALGNPFGLANRDGQSSLTMGVISALGRNLTPYLDESATQSRYYGNLIQTSGGINPGNSGGPIFDAHGRVIGVVVAVAMRSDVNAAFGFAIPITDHTRRIIETLMGGETVEYGMLGVVIDDLSAAERKELGTDERRWARIADPPEAGTAAAQAGLKLDDIITEFNGAPVGSADHLVGLVGATPVGNTVDMHYLRDGQPHTASVTIAKREIAVETPTQEESDVPEPFLWGGVLLAPLGQNLNAENLVERDDTGLLVMNVRMSTPAFRAGLRERDADGHPMVVTRVNGQRVRSIEDFRRAIRRNSSRVRFELSDGTVVIIQQ